MSQLPDDPARDRSAPSLSYEELFTRNLPALVAYLRARIGNQLAARESVRDLAQSVCREVIADIGGLAFRSEEAFRAYLFLQATRKVVDRARYHKMAMRDPAREADLPVDADERDLLRGFAQLMTPSREVAAREQLDRVQAALQTLPENQREAVLLSRIGGISYDEIARQMGLTDAAVRGLVARGLARLAATLGNDAADR